PRSPAPRERAVESRRPVGAPRRRQRRRRRAQPLASRLVERRLVEQALRQRAYVQTGSTDDHRVTARTADLSEPLRGVAREAAGAVTLPPLGRREAGAPHAGQARAP